MLALFSNASLSTQAFINRLTRPHRKRRAWQRSWHDAHPTVTGSVFFDGVLGTVMGIVLVLFFLGGGA